MGRRPNLKTCGLAILVTTAALFYSKSHPSKTEDLKSPMLDRIKSVCAKYGRPARRKTPMKTFQFVIDKEHNIGFCENAKVASSTLLKRLSDATGRSEMSRKEMKEELRAEAFGEGVEEVEVGRLIETIGGIPMVSFVRHPFHRLVSGYVDKVVNRKNSTWLEDNFGTTEVRRNFSLFVERVLAEADLNGCGGRAENDGRCDLNVHWIPLHINCAYCDVSYWLVGRLEDDFDSDVGRAFALAGLPGSDDDEEQIKLNPAEEDTELRTKSLMGSLDPGLRYRLYRLYELDFEMFGYEWKEFL